MRKFFLFFFFTVSFNLFSDNPKLPSPYNEVDVLPKHLHGWFLNAKSIKKLFSKKDITSVIELGSWLGKSTVFIAKLLPENGKIYAVDHWQGSLEHQGDTRLLTLYEQFLSNIIHENLTAKVVPIRSATYDAAKNLDVMADIIYVDAAHDEKNVFQDIYFWYPKLKSGGIMCGDDWSWGGVRNAVKKFAKVHNLEVVIEDNFWYYKQRKSE